MRTSLLPSAVKIAEFPLAALVELYHEPGAVAARLRRLHLVIVDLCHPRKTATRIEKKFYQQITRVRDTNCFDSEASSSQSTSTVEAEDVESDVEDLEEHYFSNLRRYSAILERDRPRHYTTEQLNAQEWDSHGGRDG